MNNWEAMVAVPHNGTSFIPTRMTGQFSNYLQAQAYFNSFGKILVGPKIKND